MWVLKYKFKWDDGWEADFFGKIKRRSEFWGEMKVGMGKGGFIIAVLKRAFKYEIRWDNGKEVGF